MDTRILAALFLFSFLVTVVSRQARADEAARSGAPPTEAPPYEKVVATMDGLGVLGHRYGAQVEYLPAPHDGVAFYGWYLADDARGTPQPFETDPDFSYATRTRAGGLDVQYRRYFGANGARGFFLAPGVEVQHFVTDTGTHCTGAYTYNNMTPCPASLPGLHQAFTYLGASFDLGTQAILPGGLVLAGSFGLHYRGVLGALDQSKMPFDWCLAQGPGVRPRMRLSAGWAF